MTVFVLGSFLAYLNFREGRRWWMAPSVVLFGLALLSKEPAAVFPLLIFGFALLDAQRTPNDKSNRLSSYLKSALVSLPYFAVLAIYLVARKIMLHGGGQALADVSWRTMLLTAPSILWFDLKQLLFPISSSEFYSLNYVNAPGFQGFFLPIVFLSAALVVAAYCISKLADHRSTDRGSTDRHSTDHRLIDHRLEDHSLGDQRLAVFALGLAIWTVLPTLYLRAIAHGNFVHDRLLYLPSVGIVIFIALAIGRISVSKVLSGSSQSLKWALVAILAVFAFVATISDQMQWANNLSLYENAIKYAPQNTIVEVNLANELADRGHYDRALPLYVNAVQHDSRSWLSNYNLGYAYYRTGKFVDAEDYLKRAVQIDSRDADQFIYLALAEMNRGELADATENAERAIKRGPQSPGFHFVLAKILEASGNRRGAIEEYNAEAMSHPENKAAKGELQRLQSSQQNGSN